MRSATCWTRACAGRADRRRGCRDRSSTAGPRACQTLACADLVDDGPCCRLGFLSYTGAATPLATSAIKVFHSPEATGAAADTSTGPSVADARVTSYSLPGAMDMDLLLRYDTATRSSTRRWINCARFELTAGRPNRLPAV